MLPKTHIIIGFLISLIIFLIFPEINWLNALIIFVASVLIDFDHYLYYIFKKKDHKLKNAYNWFFQRAVILKNLSLKEREKYEEAVIIFHGVECWIILLLLIFVNKIFFFIFLGVAIHMVLDFIDLYLTKNPFHIKTSQIYVHVKNKKTKNLVKL
jgi:hypothetical protein